MAALQKRGESYRVLFRYQGKQHTFTVGNVDQQEAEAKVRQVGYLLMRLKQRLISLPTGVDIVTFVEHDGNPSTALSGAPVSRRSTTFVGLRDRYLETLSNGTVERSTLYTCQIHFRHLHRILGDCPLEDLTHDRLQDYVNRRASNSPKNNVGEVTIRKEIATFRAAWNWGTRGNLTPNVFPGKGLRYPKAHEKPPFMTREEIERRISQGAAADLWESLYLQLADVEEVLAIAKKTAPYPFVYPMFCTAAFTGARRSELLASQQADFDFKGGTVVVREKKRLRGKTSTRRIPLVPRLAAVMKKWLEYHPGGATTFVKKTTTTSATAKTVAEPLTPSEAHDCFERTLRGTKWACIRGWHVFRHSFISACASKGVDQRFLDEWAGHSTEQQRRRYRHLYPSTQKEALKLVFG